MWEGGGSAAENRLKKFENERYSESQTQQAKGGGFVLTSGRCCAANRVTSHPRSLWPAYAALLSNSLSLCFCCFVLTLGISFTAMPLMLVFPSSGALLQNQYSLGCDICKAQCSICSQAHFRPQLCPCVFVFHTQAEYNLM